MKIMFLRIETILIKDRIFRLAVLVYPEISFKKIPRP